MDLNAELPPQTLTATLNRLLSTLVRNNNLVVSRDTLLTQVWEAHGQVASGNNLNNTISILRKMFAALGEDDIIVTLPRQGFMFTAASLKTTDSLAESLPEMPIPAAAESALPTRPRRTQRFKRFGLAALLLLAVGSGIWAWQDIGYAPLSAVSVGNIGSCEVKFIASYHKTGSGKADLTHLQTLLDKRNHIHCSEPATLLYYDSQSVVPGSAERVRSSYFFYCPQAAMAAGKAQCENYYESLEK
ncbi:winged helix-turn-helix domain-containing protein [Serratia marcescens]|uniref:winged helix-turn-helix domain-containing protein n=1 Tax=Serratia marcescens TaxID=615 RepID=UPI0021AB89B6|nr:winged helix-turn-helix domain-containing protein [Serratia marcescens]